MGSSTDTACFNLSFSRLRSKGSRFIGGLGAEGVFARRCVYVRNRPQPSATDRNRSRMVSSTEGVVSNVSLLRFACLVASFRVAGVALRDIQTCFVTRRKSFCVAGTILLRRFQKMRCSFRGRRSTLDVYRHSAWQAQRFRHVLLRVCLQIALAGLRQVGTGCRFRGRRGIL